MPEKRSMVNNNKTHNHSISTAETTYPVGPRMGMGIIPTFLILSAIAILSSVSTFVCRYDTITTSPDCNKDMQGIRCRDMKILCVMNRELTTMFLVIE
jgi:hypothetical protein